MGFAQHSENGHICVVSSDIAKIDMSSLVLYFHALQAGNRQELSNYHREAQ